MVKSYVGLFRGINVGGNNKLPMKTLVTMLENSGYPHVKTYLQSGNVVFQGSLQSAQSFGTLTADRIGKAYGFSPEIFVLFAPEGIGRSKLAMQAEKLLGVRVTARNWNTVSALQEMLKASLTRKV